MGISGSAAARRAGAIVGALGALVSSIAVGATATADARPACPAVSVTVAKPAPSPTGWAENLTYDSVGSAADGPGVTAGNLWVSRTFGNVVERFDESGRRTASVPVTAPGAVRQGPDGLLYVASGDTTANMFPGTPLTGQVLRMDPTAAVPRAEVFASGLGMPNGMAFDAAGRLYVADGNLGVVRIDRAGRIDEPWSRMSPKNLAPSATVNGTSTNGIVVVGNDLYVTLTTSLTGRVLRVPIDDPAATTVAADVTAPAPGLLDDLAALDARTLVVALTTGQIATIDLPTRRVCVAGVGQPVTAIVQRPGMPNRLLAGTEGGAILDVTLRR
ncbi:NHL repeat-containing protein [Gordonia insulae]|uniref:Virginiamycin B lyase n=1 Tax=Gordonia insulae TaxID=2420509 RepID=A0A3G8JLY9_9ACTN|nr:hypothetical protein [Gordonia insulae]AZG45615.1 hypothetical protein D7316_02211 [Gordonia insulae]